MWFELDRKDWREMKKGHTPYGYQIVNGEAVIDEEKADQVRKIYEGYLGGLSLTGAAKAARLDLKHRSVRVMLENRRYLGDEYYPAIIDRETFEAFETERASREKKLGRDKREKKVIEAIPAPIKFRLAKGGLILNDPYRQAEFIYNLIERED